MGPLPLAVHISDGVLTTPWLVCGFYGMALLLVPACTWQCATRKYPRYLVANGGLLRGVS